MILFIFVARARKNLGLRVFIISILYSVFLNFLILSNRTIFARFYLATLSITTIIEFFLFSYLFSRILQSIVVRRILYLATILTGIYLIYDFQATPYDAYDPVPSVISFLIILIYCIIYLYEKVKDTTVPYFYFTSTFWVVVAIIVYCAGTFFALMYAKSYFEGKNQLEYDVIHDSLYIIKNLILAIAIFSTDNNSAAKLNRGRNTLNKYT